MHWKPRPAARSVLDRRTLLLPPTLLAMVAVSAATGCGIEPGGDEGDRAKQKPPQYTALPPVARPQRRVVKVPVLTYHRVHRYADLRQSAIPDLVVEPQTFESSLAALKRRGFRSITSRQLYEALFKGKALPPNPVLITVDDGYRDAMTHILPALRRHGMVASFYVITGRLGEEEYLTAGDVRKLEAAGMDIAGHTVSHSDLTTLSEDELQREVGRSRRKLTQILGHPVYFFAYPYGRFNTQVVEAVRRAGYSVAFTTESGALLSSTRALTQPRVHVGREMTPEQVAATAEEAR